MPDPTKLNDMTALGLVGLALLILGGAIKALAASRRRSAEQGALGPIQARVEALESRIERLDELTTESRSQIRESIQKDFDLCWEEIRSLRTFRHDHASTLTRLSLLQDRVERLAEILES